MQFALDKAKRAKESGGGTGIRRNSFLGVNDGSAVRLADIGIDIDGREEESMLTSDYSGAEIAATGPLILLKPPRHALLLPIFQCSQPRNSMFSCVRACLLPGCLSYRNPGGTGEYTTGWTTSGASTSDKTVALLLIPQLEAN